MVLFALHTGLGSGDLFRLKWEDIDRTETQLKTIVRKNRNELELPLGEAVTAIVDKGHSIKCRPYVL